MQQGVFYSRWLPYRAGGLGTPLFHYYAPLAYYATQSLSFLGLEPLSALRLAFGLTLIGAALGLYLWVRDVLNRAGSALVAAAAYVCGPYLLFNTYSRDGFAEQFALLLMPFILWMVRRLVVTGQMRYWVGGVTTYAALILAHNVTGFIFSPVLLTYTIIVSRDHLHTHAVFGTHRSVMLALLAAICLGLGLSSFFWLPALIERDVIMADLLYTLPGLDYHQHFMPLHVLVVAPLTSTIRPGVSLVALGLGITGLFLVWQDSPAKQPTLRNLLEKSSIAETRELRRRQSLRRHSLWAALITAGCVLMVLPFSVWLWEVIPPLRFFQFPQRFLGTASLFIAFLAGVGTYSLKQRLKYSRAAGMFFIIFLLLSHTWGLVQVRYYLPLPAIDVDFTMQKEREQGLFNAIYIGNFIPTTVKTLPSAAQLARVSVERLDSSSLPVEATLLAAAYGPLRYDVTLTSPRPLVLRFNTFYFPGWQAQLDDQSAPIAPTDPNGLISVQVPAGQHHLVVWFGSTPLRTLANVLTVSSAVMLGSVTIMMWLRRSK
jgi:hypothetical protein